MNKTILAVIFLAAGIFIGTLFKGCGVPNKPLILEQVDTLVIDTSKIIYKTPIIIQQVQAPVVDYYHDCWNSLPTLINSHGDTLSIDSVNSCKGIYKGIHQSYKPDTVKCEVTKIIRDTVKEAVNFEPLFAQSTEKFLNFNVVAKAGIGYNALFGTALDLNLGYGRIGINISPSLYYLDKFRGFIFIGATYKIIE